MNIQILATILALVVSQIDAGALNLNLRAFPDHVLATENEVLEEKCTGLQDDLFHPKWVFTRDDLIQANLVECKCKISFRLTLKFSLIESGPCTRLNSVKRSTELRF